MDICLEKNGYIFYEVWPRPETKMSFTKYKVFEYFKEDSKIFSISYLKN